MPARTHTLRWAGAIGHLRPFANDRSRRFPMAGRASSGLRTRTFFGPSPTLGELRPRLDGSTPLAYSATMLTAASKHSVDGIFLPWHDAAMAWEVEYTDEFGAWWAGLSEDEQVSVAASVKLLEERGPNLRYPHSSGINGSKHGHMRELRTQHDGKPLRTLYAFDPRRTAILLIGGDKTGDDRWYETFVPLADRLYNEHLDGLRKEGAV